MKQSTKNIIKWGTVVGGTTAIAAGTTYGLTPVEEKVIEKTIETPIETIVEKEIESPTLKKELEETKLNAQTATATVRQLRSDLKAAQTANTSLRNKVDPLNKLVDGLTTEKQNIAKQLTKVREEGVVAKCYKDNMVYTYDYYYIGKEVKQECDNKQR